MYLMMSFDRNYKNKFEVDIYDLNDIEDVLTVHLDYRKDLTELRFKTNNAVKYSAMDLKKKRNVFFNNALKVIKEYEKRELYIKIVEIPIYAKSVSVLFDNYVNEFVYFYNIEPHTALKEALNKNMIFNLGTRTSVLELVSESKDSMDKTLLYSNMYKYNLKDFTLAKTNNNCDDVIYETEVSIDNNSIYLLCKDKTYNDCIEVTKNNDSIEIYKNIYDEIKINDMNELRKLTNRCSFKFKQSMEAIIAGKLVNP